MSTLVHALLEVQSRIEEWCASALANWSWNSPSVVEAAAGVVVEVEAAVVQLLELHAPDSEG